MRFDYPFTDAEVRLNGSNSVPKIMSRLSSHISKAEIDPHIPSVENLAEGDIYDGKMGFMRGEVSVTVDTIVL